VAMPNEKEPAVAHKWEISDRLQVASITVSVVALGVALYAAVSANDATATANRLAASAASASLRLASPVTAAGGRPTYEVSLNLTNQGGGDAQSIKAYIGTLVNIHSVNFVGACPQPLQYYRFSFPLGTTLGVNSPPLSGKAMVPMAVLPRNGTPANSMVLYVSWQDTDGITEADCENLSNTSTVGNLALAPRRLLRYTVAATIPRVSMRTDV
jgi:hypothetical protein